LNNRIIKGYPVFIIIVCFMMMLFTSCAALQAVFQNPNYLYEDGAILVGGDDRPIRLKNNPQAADVSYAALLDFLRQDPTDLKAYVARGSSSGQAPFVCSDFAEAVHNNAEAAGIRTGYVTLDFIEGGLGHAVNAFQTPDKGIVYIDCTGKSDYSQIEDSSNQATIGVWDKVAYMEIGRKYGVISLNQASSPLYEYYDQFELKWQQYKERLAAYNEEVKQYNLEIKDKVYRRGSPELARIRDWEARLTGEENEINALRDEIGTFRFRPLGLVKSYNIHW
jgi:hypothetical protein